MVSLPMYGIARPQVERFWLVLREHLNQQGGAELPPMLTWPQDLLAHWQQPDLLLSQTCGYPLVSLLPQVQLVGVYHYRAAGCGGPNYRSWLVVREHDAGQRLVDFRHRVVAYNSRDSQSGYNGLRALIAPLARNGRFFRTAIASGGHLQSLSMVQNGQADIAAVDCVSYALLQQSQPQALAGLKIIGCTAKAPGLPLITSATTSAQQLAALRHALSAMVDEPVSESLLICGFSPIPRSAYRVIIDRERQAAALGVTAL